jgi:hypothetical protein
MNHSRKVVTSIALGLALVVVAAAVTRWLEEQSDGGWFMYSPNSSPLMDLSSDGTNWATPVVWLAAIGIWFAVSWRLFRCED